MRRFRPTLVAGAVALALTAGTASAQFTNTYVFGDSLSDAGQYGARFTTNPGLVTPMYIGQNFGIAVTPSFQGGNDYAQGGARVNSPQLQPPPGVPDYSVAQQVNLFLGKGPLNPTALYQIQGGANDILTQATLFSSGQITQPQMQAAVVQAATDLAIQVGKLKAAGAQYVIVQNLPDMGKAPLATGQGPQAVQLFSGLSLLFNTTLNAAVASAGLQVLQFNTQALLNEILANPSLYGFVNANKQVCTVPSALNCTPSTLLVENGNLTYVFADALHPTTGTDLLQTQAMMAMISGPQQMAALGEAPMDVERANWRTLDGRMMSAINAPATTGKIQAWAAYDYADADIFGPSLSGSGDLNTIAVGADYRVSGNMMAGVQFAYTEYNGDFGNGSGDFKLREPMMTAYGGLGQGPWYVGATLGLGALEFSSNRSIALGATTRTETGDTNGYHVVGRLLGGYWFRYSNLDHGPFAKLTYQKIVVRQFSENGNDSTALTYEQQNNDSFWSSLGWQATGDVNGFRPFARATWEYNFQSDTRQVTARSSSLNGWYTMPGFEQDDNFWLFDVGVSRNFGNTTGFLSGNVSAGKGDGDYWAITVGIRVPL